MYSLADERTNEVLELYNKIYMNYGEMYIIEESEQRKHVILSIKLCLYIVIKWVSARFFLNFSRIL